MFRTLLNLYESWKSNRKDFKPIWVVLPNLVLVPKDPVLCVELLFGNILRNLNPFDELKQQHKGH
jgi:hypothetical protein